MMMMMMVVHIGVETETAKNTKTVQSCTKANTGTKYHESEHASTRIEHGRKEVMDGQAKKLPVLVG